MTSKLKFDAHSLVERTSLKAEETATQLTTMTQHTPLSAWRTFKQATGTDGAKRTETVGTAAMVKSASFLPKNYAGTRCIPLLGSKGDRKAEIISEYTWKTRGSDSAQPRTLDGQPKGETRAGGRRRIQLVDKQWNSGQELAQRRLHEGDSMQRRSNWDLSRYMPPISLDSLEPRRKDRFMPSEEQPVQVTPPGYQDCRLDHFIPRGLPPSPPLPSSGSDRLPSTPSIVDESVTEKYLTAAIERDAVKQMTASSTDEGADSLSPEMAQRPTGRRKYKQRLLVNPGSPSDKATSRTDEQVTKALGDSVDIEKAFIELLAREAVIMFEEKLPPALKHKYSLSLTSNDNEEVPNARKHRIWNHAIDDESSHKTKKNSREKAKRHPREQKRPPVKCRCRKVIEVLQSADDGRQTPVEGGEVAQGDAAAAPAHKRPADLTGYGTSADEFSDLSFSHDMLMLSLSSDSCGHQFVTPGAPRSTIEVFR